MDQVAEVRTNSYKRTALFSVFLLVPAAWGGGLWLYELGTPELGTAGAGRVAAAKDASTAFGNPAGMTRLDRSQMLAAVQGLYYDAQFDTELSGFGGGDGGDAGGYVPAGSLHHVHRVTDDFRLGISAGSYFGLGVDYGDRWAVMGNIGWQQWSEFGKQDLTLRSTTSTTFTKDLDYDDTWHFALGTQYRFADSWLWSVGAAYDTSPTDEDTRTPDMPLDRQIRIGTGIQYDWNEDVTINYASTTN